MSRDSSQKVNSELFSLEPTALLEFFVIHYDYINAPDEKLYIHGGTNGINGSIFWQGVEYVPFPIQSSGFESKGDGSLPRPKLAVSNQDFFISNLVRRYNNLVGAKVVRKRTFVKFLDSRNFAEEINPYGAADPNAGLEDQIFFILRRSSESRAAVEFELASPLEIENVTFPKRTVMARYCSFHYRGSGCRYMGPPVADENNLRLTLPTDLNQGSLIRRKYTTTGGFPVTSAALNTKFVNATYSNEVLSSNFTLENLDLYLYEYVGYFRVDYGEAGTYQFQVNVNDTAEVYIDGNIVCSYYKPTSGNAVGTGTGSVTLKQGYNRFLLRYYEANGVESNQSLSLNYKIPNSTSFIAVPFTRFFYDPTEYGFLTSSERFYTKLSLTRAISLSKDTVLGGETFTGLWRSGTNYRAGDYVCIQNHNVKVPKRDVNTIPNWEPLQRFYFCVKNHTGSPAKNPSFNKEYWVADQCSRTIEGCKLRFGNKSHLPFGGFPGTEEYSISA